MRKLLIAGIGNIFRGDDAFGCELARLLAGQALPDGIQVKDYGIRGFDLACDILQGYDGAILLDAMPRGRQPGTIYLLEPEIPEGRVAMDPHGLTPEHVLRMITILGGKAPWLRVVGCEPESLGEDEAGGMGLSETVRRSLAEAARMTEEIAREFLGCPAPTFRASPAV